MSARIVILAEIAHTSDSNALTGASSETGVGRHLRILVAVFGLTAVLAAQPERVVSPLPEGITRPSYKYASGHLAAFQRGEQPVALWDRGGRLLYEAEARLPGEGSPLVRVLDVAIGRGGRLLVAGPWSETNRGVVILDAAGNSVVAFDLYPFFPERLTLGPEGNLWVLGRRTTGPGKPGIWLNKYSLGGEQLLAVRIPVAGAAKSGYLGASNTGLGIWFAGAAAWFTLSPAGKIIERLRLRPPGGQPARFTFSAAGEIYADAGALYRYDRRAHRWRSVPDVLPEPMPPAELIGADGPRLIYRLRGTEALELLRLPH